MNYYKAKTYQDFKYISNLFKPENVEFFETKKISITELKKLNSNSRRNDYILINDKKDKIGWFNIRQSINKKDGVFGIIIDKKFQDRGYGKQAIKIILKEVKKLGIKKLKLTVFEDNLKAIHIYKKAGFQPVRKEIVMDKDI